MNILIYGDNSAAGLNLIPGFEEFGFEVDYVSNDDCKRGYFVSIPLRVGKSKLVRKTTGIVNSLKLPIILKKKYEIIIMANPYIGPLSLSKFVLQILRNRTSNLYWWITTCDSKMRLWSKTNNKVLCQKCNKGRGTVDVCPKYNPHLIKFENRVADFVDKIIPCSFEYASGHIFNKNNKFNDIKVIPLAVSSRISFNKKICDDSSSNIKFYHGAESIFKGSDIIKNAFNSFFKSYENNVTFHYGSYMKLDQYIDFIAYQDVIIDQLYNKSFGINALLVMQSGRLLIAGDCQQFESFIGIKPAPMVRLNGDYENLVEKLEETISDWNYYSDLRKEGPNYVAKYFSPKVIARKFLDFATE